MLLPILLITTSFGLALASTPPSIQVPIYPPTSQSLGFVLVANLTDPSKDLSPSVNNLFFSSFRFIASSYLAVLSQAGSRTFYLNGTKEEVAAGNATVGADQMVYPFGLWIDTASESIYGSITVGIGIGTRGVGIRSSPVPYPSVFTPWRGTFVVCNETNPDNNRPQFPISYLKSEYRKGAEHLSIPERCVPITLLAQCVSLDPPVSGAEYNHDYAQPVPCYENVATIDWTKYSSWP